MKTTVETSEELLQRAKAVAVRELWTADRDFSRIAGLRTHNPLRN